MIFRDIGDVIKAAAVNWVDDYAPVSYTHLTLPTTYC
jgi:hypothetical protein